MPTISGSVGPPAPRLLRVASVAPRVPSLARGVVHAELTACADRCFPCPRPSSVLGAALVVRFALGLATGVAHDRTASSSIVPGCITPVVVVCRAELRESATVAVGQDPDAVPLVGSPNVACAKTSPLCIEPEGGKSSKDVVETSSSNKGRDVFKQHEIGSNFAKHAGDFRPDPPLVLGSKSSSGRAPKVGS